MGMRRKRQQVASDIETCTLQTCNPVCLPEASGDFFGSSSLCLEHTQHAGRGCFATQQIIAGELVLRANVAATTVESRHRSLVCHNCLVLSETPLLSCSGGCSVAAYCTEACAAVDRPRHSLECPVLARLEAMKLPKGEATLARLLCSMLAGESESKHLANVTMLQCDHAAVPQFRRRQRQREAAVKAVALAVQGTHLANVSASVDLQSLLAAVPLNEFGLIDDIGDTRGTAVAPVAAFVNHSCFPNVAKRFEGRNIVMYAIRDISPGDEVVFSYLSRDIVGSERKQALWNTWQIPCQCGRCIGSKLDEAMEALDSQCGCCCAGFRIPNVIDSGRCWCLATQVAVCQSESDF